IEEIGVIKSKHRRRLSWRRKRKRVFVCGCIYNVLVSELSVWWVNRKGRVGYNSVSDLLGWF
ncbi:hypothetical protein, partial [Cytobacillus oceanisediminis]|uniref:hypothetical protein n=1 Tax=Cytobacillus oceanisediminis TaxID=665099 RepID=UPI001C92FEE6